MKWTPEQDALFAAIGQSHVIVDALAGSAKTTSIVEAVNRLIKQRPVDTILMVAFNKKTADELAKKVPKTTTVKTLNALGHGAWSRHLGRALTLDTNKIGDIVGDLCREHDCKDLWADIKGLVDAARNSGLVPHNAPRGHRTLLEDTPEQWEELADYYDHDKAGISLARQALLTSISQAFDGLIDFNDQLYMPVCWQANFTKYDHVFVDEMQDLSRIQHIMVEKSLKLSGKLCGVGDENQAIYAFRGAASNSMQLAKDKFKPNILPLTICFRCSKEVVHHAQELVPAIQPFESARLGKINTLTKWDESIFSAGSAIICRNNAPLIAVAFRLIRKGVSCHMLGRDLGRGLLSVIKKLTDGREIPIAHFVQALRQWQTREVLNARSKRDQSKEQKVVDKAESIRAVIRFAKVRTIAQLTNEINSLFDKSVGKVTLTTAHRSKGMEWMNTYILEPDLFGQYASSEWQIIQDRNLKYVAITRSQDTLTYINYDGWEAEPESESDLPGEVGYNHDEPLSAGDKELSTIGATGGLANN